MQRQSFARACLEACRPADALVWLQGSWGHLDDSRQDLPADALEQLGRFEGSSPIRQGLFDRTLSDFHFQRWLQPLSEAARIDGDDDGRLVPLAKVLRKNECPRGETVVYRALLHGILDRTKARACAHAARYWARLAEPAGTGLDLRPLSPHEEFAAEIRTRHKRKSAFWACVNGTRRDRRDEDHDANSGTRSQPPPPPLCARRALPLIAP